MLGLVLEGGGAKGSYHAGAFKAFVENGINFDGVMGTSIGAINGAFVAQCDMQKGIELWSTLVPSSITDLDDEKLFNLFNRKLDRSTLRYLLKIIRELIVNRGLPIDKIMHLLRNLIDEDKLRASKIDFGLITISITDRRPMEIFKEEIPYGMLHDYIMASSYHPTFKTELIDGKKYFDGGVFDNLPINPLIRRGYEEIIAIRTMSRMPRRPVIDDSVKVTYIIPSDKLGGTIKIHPQSLLTNVQMGYYDTLRMLKNHKGQDYYFNDMSKHDFYQLILSFSEKTFTAFKEVFNLAPESDNQTVLNNLMAEIKNIVQGSYWDSDYQLFLLFIEKYGKIFDIERYKVYNLDNYLQLLAEAQRKLEKQDKSSVIEKLKNTIHNNKGSKIFTILINNYIGE